MRVLPSPWGRGTVTYTRTLEAHLDLLSNRGKRLVLNPEVGLPTLGISKAPTSLQYKPELAGWWQEPLVHTKSPLLGDTLPSPGPGSAGQTGCVSTREFPGRSW